MTDLFQSDYEQLEGIAGRFGQQREEAQQSLAAIKQGVDALAGGGWIGEGSDAFIEEMEGDMFPAMHRLIEALNEAQRVTFFIKQTIQQAEEEASAPFRGGFSGGPAGAGVSGSGNAGLSGTGSGNFGGASGTISGGSVGAGGTVNAGSDDTFLEKHPTVGFRIFGVGFGTHQLIQWARGASKASPAFRAIPIVGGVIGTVDKILEANANGENMDFAVGREIATGTLKTEVYLVPGLNIVAGGGELLHMFGVTDTNYTDEAVRAVAEPLHEHVLDPLSDGLAEGMWQADRGIRWGWNKAGDLIDKVEWPF